MQRGCARCDRSGRYGQNALQLGPRLLYQPLGVHPADRPHRRDGAARAAYDEVALQAGACAPPGAPPSLATVPGPPVSATDGSITRGGAPPGLQVAALAVSCAAGVAMSYFAFLCRAAVSATSFTVIGNVCKILTVLINVCIWDKHASPLGLGALLCCLAAAATYQQSAPPPPAPKANAPTARRRRKSRTT